MEEKKKNKIIILILISIIVLLLAVIAYFLLKKDAPSKLDDNTTTTTTTTITTTTTEATVEEVDGPNVIRTKLNAEKCVSGLGEYYLDHDTYIISGLRINNEDATFKYLDQETRKYYINDKLLFTTESNEAILTSLCNYENYILITMGWEGYPTTSVYDSEGTNMLMFTGDFSYKNGLLLIEEYDYNMGDEFYTMTNYSVNLAKKDFTKHKTGENKIDCGEAIYVC